MRIGSTVGSLLHLGLRGGNQVMTVHLSARLAWHMEGWNGRVCRDPNGLALSDQVWAEQVELESPDDVGDARLAGSAGREVAGFLGLAGAGPVRAVPGEGARGEDLEQERGEREISLLRGKKPRPCPSRRPGRAES